MKERHELLLQTLGGSFDEEEHAYRLVSKISWILPINVVCGGVFDMIVIFSYMRFAHPWKDILYGEEVSENFKKVKEVSQVNDNVMHTKAFNTKVNLQNENKRQHTSFQDHIR